MNLLRQFRDALGWSQQKLADNAVPPCSQAQIDRLEKGERKLDFEWARRLAPALGRKWPELIDSEDLPERTAEVIIAFEDLLPPQQEAVLALMRSMALDRIGRELAAGAEQQSAYQLNEPPVAYSAERRRKA